MYIFKYHDNDITEDTPEKTITFGQKICNIETVFVVVFFFIFLCKQSPELKNIYLYEAAGTNTARSSNLK